MSVFKSLSHFEFIVLYVERVCSNFIDLHTALPFSHHHLLKRLSLLRCIFLPPLSKIDCTWLDLLLGLRQGFEWKFVRGLILGSLGGQWGRSGERKEGSGLPHWGP